MSKPKLDYFSPLPPLKSGISDYSEELLKELKKHFNITAFIDDNYNPKPIEGIEIKSHKDYNDNHPTIHNIGNSALHIYSYKKLRKNPGIILLHDSHLHSLNFERMQDDWSKLFFLKEVLINHGPRAVFDYIKFFFTKPYLNHFVCITLFEGAYLNIFFIPIDWNLTPAEEAACWDVKPLDEDALAPEGEE